MMLLLGRDETVRGGGFGFERNAMLSLLSVCVALCFRCGSTYSLVNEVSGAVTGKKNSCVFVVSQRVFVHGLHASECLALIAREKSKGKLGLFRTLIRVRRVPKST